MYWSYYITSTSGTKFGVGIYSRHLVSQVMSSSRCQLVPLDRLQMSIFSSVAVDGSTKIPSNRIVSLNFKCQ
jgi:hypothetical protein